MLHTGFLPNFLVGGDLGVTAPSCEAGCGGAVRILGVNVTFKLLVLMMVFRPMVLWLVLWSTVFLCVSSVFLMPQAVLPWWWSPPPQAYSPLCRLVRLQQLARDLGPDGDGESGGHAWLLVCVGTMGSRLGLT